MRAGLLIAAALCASLMAGCASQAPQPDAVITGLAWTRERVILPPDVVFEATLLDVTQPELPPVVLGRQRYAPVGQAPFAIAIPYLAARFVPQRRYEVRATVTLEGRLLLASDRRHPVPQDAAFRRVDVPLQRWPALDATVQAEVPLVLTHWRLTEIEEETVAPPARGGAIPYLVLQADEARAAGSGGCNRFFADYVVQGDRLRFGRVDSGITLCLPGSAAETRFFDALSRVVGFWQEGTQLLLQGGDGRTLLRFKAVQAEPH